MLRGAVGREGAEDAFQETFLAALRAYPSLRRRAQPARLAGDDRAPQGDRPPPGAGTCAGPGRRRCARRRSSTPIPPTARSGVGRGAAAEAAGRGDPALRQRPPARGDRRGARLLAGGGAPQPARGTETTAKGDGMTATMDNTVINKSLERLRERAAAEGLLDVAYATADSPFGTLLLARTPQGLVRLGLPSEDVEATLADLAERISPRVLEAPDRARRGAARARGLLRGPPPRVRAADRLAAQPRLPAPRPRRASPRSPTARPAPTPTSPARPATSARSAPPARPARATRSRSSSPATGWCAATAASASTRAASR